VRRSRQSRLQGRIIADAWQAIGRAAADFEGRKRAIALDQVAAVISNYSERASSPHTDAYLTHEEVGYLAATDVRLHFWTARSLELDVPTAVLGNLGDQIPERTRPQDAEQDHADTLVEWPAAS
jgi:hypothetical protein